MQPSTPQPLLLSFAFRPFFLLTALYAVILIGSWSAYFFGYVSLPQRWPLIHWHVHEMLLGLLPAAIAGFLLTAICNWTGAPPIQGRWLLLLILTWLAGRIAMWLSTLLQVWLVALLDLAFLTLLIGMATQILLRYGNHRNLLLVALLGTLLLANLMMHLSHAMPELFQRAQLLSLNGLLLLLAIIAGRITPAFSGNWLKMRGGDPNCIRRSPRLDAWALGSLLALLLADLLLDVAYLSGALALVAAGLHALRLWGWRGWKFHTEPLLWILHLGYLWLVVALLLRGGGQWLEIIPATLWTHALGVGAMGTLLLGVMTRVALGHTGRTLKLPRWAVLTYFMITLAALVRLAAAGLWIDYRLGLLLSTLLWCMAFALYFICYWPILSKPRVDGRPG